MNSQASRVAVVNQVARQLVHSGHPGETQIRAQQDQLNTRRVGRVRVKLGQARSRWNALVLMAVLSVFRWSQFRDLVDQKKENLNSALGIQNYHLECNETKSWIKEKTKVRPGPTGPPAEPQQAALCCR